MAKRLGKPPAISLDEFPDSVRAVIERHRYQAVRSISIAGLSIAMGVGLFTVFSTGTATEALFRAAPLSTVFVVSLLINQRDRSARRSGLFLMLFSAIAMTVVRLFSASTVAGHFLFFPAAAIGSVLLAGFRAGLILAGVALGGLYAAYFINFYFHPFTVLISTDRSAAIVGAFLMTFVMIVLAGRLLRDVQREYESSNLLLTAHFDRYRSFLSLLTNDLGVSISNLKEAASRQDGDVMKKSLKDIRHVIATARQLRNESVSKQN